MKTFVTTHKSLDLQKMLTIQVGKNLFGFKHDTTPAEFVMWSDLQSTQPMSTLLSTPPTPREYPSLANYADSFIFVIAGTKPDTSDHYYASVDMYTIGTDTWS